MSQKILHITIDEFPTLREVFNVVKTLKTEKTTARYEDKPIEFKVQKTL